LAVNSKKFFNKALTPENAVNYHFRMRSLKAPLEKNKYVEGTMETSQSATDIRALNEKIEQESAFIDLLMMEVNKSIIGQKEMLERLLIALLGNGHILLEGVPGLAKTLAIKSLAQAIDAKYSRIQFTPDLLPSDVVGTQIYNIQKNEFAVKEGPVFANFVLADEINRAPAKVQSALLEAMQERQVTIGEETHRLPEPFLVLATQNPVEQEGTYPLPEAQSDRFMLKTVITYPSKEDERLIMRQNLSGSVEEIRPVVKMESILKARKMVREVYMDEKIERYILDIIFATRKPEDYRLPSLKPLIEFGASPRGSISLATAAKVHAFIKRRGYVIPEDVRAVVGDVLRHRIGITYEAEAENVSSEDLIHQIVDQIEVP
jgi:MoxR-like ATPase